MQQQEMDFSAPLSRSSDPDGSHVAASRSNAVSNRAIVLEQMRAINRPLTSKQIGELCLTRHEVARRLPDLEKLNLVERCGYLAGTKEQLWRVRT